MFYEEFKDWFDKNNNLKNNNNFVNNIKYFINKLSYLEISYLLNDSKKSICLLKKNYST